MATSGQSDDLLLGAAALWEKQVDNVDVLMAVASLERATKLVNDNIELLLRPFNITYARYSVLTRLYYTPSGALTLGDIATRLLLHPTSVTSAVDKLERDGLVERRPHPSDRRATYASITKDGRALVRKTTTLLTKQNWGFGELSVDRLNALTLLLRDVRAASGDEVAAAADYHALLRRD